MIEPTKTRAAKEVATAPMNVVLRKIASDYFNDSNAPHYWVGICAAYVDRRYLSDRYISYKEMDCLLTAAQTDFCETLCGYLDFRLRNRSEWEPRAWMCLFLAEFIESGDYTPPQVLSAS